ncbi:ankyrin repeat-containing protein [Fusarium phyllophilum]|uniref:Ankyrin repeat-containing protein n=1 Tax=Fusarium phyllophilum TaxID=47803 RepID=A0A8H5JXY8_9HYPO|nr:ankyrin repeat-containing protein [Fusarium phyllophilum]
MPRLTDKFLHRRKRRTPEDKDAASEISEARSELIVETTNPATGQAQVSAPANSNSQAVSKKTKSLNFWQEAYEEILEDEDEQIKKILDAYDVLLESAVKTHGGIASSNTALPRDTQTQVAYVGFSNDSWSADDDIEDPSSSELFDADIPQTPSTRRVVGDDAKMRAIVKIKLDEMQQKEWVVKWHGHVFKVREEVTRIVGIVQKISGFANQTAGLNPYSGLAWAGVRGRRLHGKHEDFEKLLVAMYRKITLFYVKAACCFARSTLKRMLRGVAVLDDWKSTVANLGKADEECQAFVTTLGLSASLKKGDQILERLSRIETSNQIDRIKTWLLSDVARKTSLVSIVVSSLRSLRIENVAFFYYSVDTSKTLQTPNTVSRLEQIFRGLVGQLAMSPDKTRVTEEVEIAFEEALKHGTLQPAPLGWEGAKSLLIKIIASRRNSTIIIDGIDEFPEFTKLLKELKAIHDAVKPGQLRLLLASQTVVPVSEYFPSTILMVAGGEKSKPDMNAFIQRRVELFRTEHPKALTQAVADDMVETLSENAEGMFKWADLCLKRVLYDDDTLHIQENWKSVKRQHFRGLLVGLVVSYEQLYQKGLPESYSRQRRSQLENDANRVLLWVLGAKAQLGWTEYSALHPEGDASTGPVSKICQNFLHTSENAIIAASHSSVWDYVSLRITGQVAEFIECAEGDEEQEQRSASILKKAKEETALLAQKRIVQDCLAMLVDSDDSAFPADGQTQSPLLRYACHNWYKHVDAITEEEGVVPAELQDQLTAMFDSRFIKRWVSVYDSNFSDSTADPDPLYYATLLGYNSIVKLLLESGVGSQTGGHLGQTLQLAAFQGKTAIVRNLLEKGFNINQADEVLGTPLQAAIAGGQRELVNVLLDDYSADVEASGVSFGNALQMALTMQDQDIAATLRAHGARLKKTTRRDRIWDTAWRSAQISRFNADRANDMLRKSSFMTPKLPEGINRWLKVLAICIHHRREMSLHQKLADYSERVWRSNQPLRVDIDKERAWQTIVERLRDTEVATLGFVPATCTWLLLAYCQFGTNTSIPKHASTVIKTADTIYKILFRHETFIRNFPENVPTLELEEILVNLFSHIISLTSDVTEYLSQLLSNGIRSSFRLFIRSKAMELHSDKMLEVQDLHKNAMIAEDNARSMATLYQVLSEHNDRTTYELKEMRREITELKADIGDLTQKMDLLISLLKPSQS